MANLQHTNVLRRWLVAWTTPRSTDQDERFRERTIRGMIVIWGMILLILVILYVGLAAWARIDQVVIALLLIIGAVIALNKGHISLAGWSLILQSIIFSTISMFQVGYWAPGTIATSILALFLGAMLLPMRSARIIPFVLIVIYGGGAFWLDAHGVVSPLPSPFATPLSSTIGFSLIIIGLSGAGFYFLEELTAQRNKLKSLVNTLEDQVAERTIALQRSNEQLHTEIQERTQAEAALRQSETQLRAILDTLPIPIIVATSGENFLYANPVAISLFKIDVAGSANATTSFQLEASDRQQVAETIQAQGYTKALEVHYKNMEGASRAGLLTIQPFQFTGQAAYLAALIDITDLKIAQEAERQQRNLTQALLDATLILTSSLQLDEVIEHTLSNLSRVVQHDVANILIVEGEYGIILGLKSNLDGTKYEIVRSRVLIKDEYYHNLMLQTRQPVRLADISTDPKFVRISQNPVIRAFLGLPILAGQEVIGFLNLGSQQADYFTEAHVRYLQIFTLQAGIAIQNARLYKQAQTIAALEERNRLARELHDSVSQTLFAANSIAETLPRLFEVHPEKVQHYIHELHHLTRGAMAEMRSLLFELRPEAMLKTEFTVLLDQLCDVFVGRTQIEVDRHFTNRVQLPPTMQIVFYRIAQESLNNIAKHAQASHVVISLSTADNFVELRIRDDGCGFDVNEVPANHFGLKIMAERVSEIQAQFAVNSQMNQGTEIVLRSNLP